MGIEVVQDRRVQAGRVPEVAARQGYSEAVLVYLAAPQVLLVLVGL